MSAVLLKPRTVREGVPSGCGSKEPTQQPCYAPKFRRRHLREYPLPLSPRSTSFLHSGPRAPLCDPFPESLELFGACFLVKNVRLRFVMGSQLMHARTPARIGRSASNSFQHSIDLSILNPLT